MSTYIYLECLEHDPPMSSNGEVGQHLYDLDDVRKMIAHRDLIVRIFQLDLPISWDNHFHSNTAYFLAKHLNCRIRIVDEYGKEHPLVKGKKCDLHH